jgi:hypothetical protein
VAETGCTWVGDGRLQPSAVLLSVCATIKRQGINPWVYLKHVLSELPDVWSRSRGGPRVATG